MSKYLIDSTTMEGIASSIKQLTGNNGSINGSNLVTTLSNIEVKQPDPFEAEYNDNILRFFFDFKDSDYLHLYIKARLKGTIVINWGDNTNTETYTGHNTVTQNTIIDHQYSNIGKYIISITRSSSSDEFGVYYYTYSGGVCFGNCNDMGAYINGSAINLNFNALISLVRVYEGWSFSSTGNDNSCRNVYAYCPFIKRIDFSGNRTNNAKLSVSNGHSNNGNTYMKYISMIIEKVTLPNDLSGFYDYAFSYCSKLSNINIPSGVTSIPNYCFYDCISLKMNSLPSNITTIGNYAFGLCLNFSGDFTFYGDIASIGNNAFDGGAAMHSQQLNITKYKFPNNTKVPTLGTNAFNNIKQDTLIVVPDSLYEEWIAASNWVNYASHIIKESEDI